MPTLKIIGERTLPLDLSRHPDAPTAEEAAQREMDHAPDLLYDSGDTVYRFELLDEAPAASPSPLELIDELEAVLARLKERVSQPD